jgi:formylglycine-generating enzyme
MTPFRGFSLIAIGVLCSCSRGPATGTSQAREVDASFEAPAPTAAPSSPPIDASFDAPGPVDPVGDPTCPHPPTQVDCGGGGLCRIEPGCFLMGSPRDEPGANADDVQVKVTLTRPFMIGIAPITRGTWMARPLDLPTFTREEDGPASCTEHGCPVVYISFEEALTFTNRLSEGAGLTPCYELSECTGTFGDNMRCESIRTTADTPYECEGYRLPMEAEWEYAARAGTRSTYYSGDILTMGETHDAAPPCSFDPNLDSIGWYCHNAGGQAQPVRRKEPNGWYLHDMLGNVSEYCNDLKLGGYGEGPLVDPVGTVIVDRELTHPEHRERIVRGGSYREPPAYTKASTRMTATGANISTGFRIARTCFPGVECRPRAH